ncbi:endonuclease domain-containing protein [Longimicrobium sp.]|uniref:endonuclease domain-containing protein n=1 Tax=Longimicrobium sp. TaxID=2029185 RepID=UPI003B3B2E95
MSRNTSYEVRQAAREMRKNPTPAEKALWRVLRNRAVNGLRFRRQHTLDGLVLDFYCPEVRLCVELDGDVHDAPEQQERDAARTAHLQARDIRVLRFRNEEVLSDMRSVLTLIARTAAEPVRTGQSPTEVAHGR